MTFESNPDRGGSWTGVGVGGCGPLGRSHHDTLKNQVFHIYQTPTLKTYPHPPLDTYTELC